MFKLPKYLFLLFSIAFFNYTAGQKLTVSYTNVSLTKVLGDISQHYHIKIAFDTQLADKITINQKLVQVPLDEAIVRLLGSTGLKAEQMGDVYMIIPDVPSEKTKVESANIIQRQAIKIKKYIIGVVKDIQTGETLPFAGIYSKSHQLGTTANADGFFKLEMKDEDSVYLLVSFLGYEPLTVRAKASTNPSLLSVMLKTQLEQLKAIMVGSKIEILENRGTRPDVIKLCPSKMSNIPAITELDISTTLQMLPGVSGCNENAGGFSIRKAPSDKTLMVYDGFTIYYMNHFFGSFSSINTKAVKDIQVYKIPDDAHFGGSTAGIIEITGKSGNTQNVSVNAGIDMLAADIEAEIPIVKDKCSFLLAGRRSYTDHLRTPLYYAMFENARYEFQSYYLKPPVAFSTNSSDPHYYFDDFNTKLSINTSGGGNFSLSTFRSKDNLNFLQSAEYPKIKERTNWRTSGASLRWAGAVTNSWNTEFVAGFSNTTFNYAISDSIQKFRKRILRTIEYIISKETNIDLWLKNFSIQSNNKFQLSETQFINLGFGIQSVNSHYGLVSTTYVNSIDISC
jgi:ferric enterobactin receptor